MGDDEGSLWSLKDYSEWQGIHYLDVSGCYTERAVYVNPKIT